MCLCVYLWGLFGGVEIRTCICIHTHTRLPLHITYQSDPNTQPGFVVGEDDEHDPLAFKGGRYGRVPETVSATAEEEGLIGTWGAGVWV